MTKKMMFFSLILVGLALLSACSSSLSAGTATPAASGLTLQEKLGIGILQLEDTQLAVDAQQADTLLPLWKAVRALSADDVTTDAEMAALYQQIQESLTSAQVQAIEQMAWSDSDLAALMQEYGSQTTQASASTSSSSSVQAQGGPDGGMMTGGEAPMDMSTGGIEGMSSAPVEQSSSTVEAGPSNTSSLNLMLADSVITLLNQHVSA